jgi:hypothetical protein
LEQIADKCYNEIIPNENERIMILLVDKVYYNMARFEEFNQFRREKNVN